MNPDDFDIRCPRLGSTVRFCYCRTCGDGQNACFGIFDCWWERFDVVAHLRKTLSEEEFVKLAVSRPKPKVSSLIELIAKTRGDAAGGEAG